MQNTRMTDNLLPTELRQLLTAVGTHLSKGESVAAELPAVISAMSALPAATISQSALQIATTAKLFRQRAESSWSQKLFRQPLTDKEQLLKLPNLQYLFLFHFDGRIREISLRRINEGLPSPFWFAAICLRLNDWADPVRKAALSCAERCFPLTTPDVIADGAVRLVLSQHTWGRWSDERAAVDAALQRPDVAERMADIICDAQTGPVSRILRLLLKHDAIDIHLARLAANARQPAVRAMAFQVIVDMKASWPVGWDWKWIDKSFGQRVKVPSLNFRDLKHDLDRLAFVRSAALDKAAIVRRAALDALIRHFRGTDAAKELAERLLTDPNASVRERASFILSKIPEATAVQSI
jgi:hypothetical protein